MAVSGARLPAAADTLNQFLSALFEPADLLQFEAYPKPWKGRGPVRRYTVLRAKAIELVGEMEAVNNPPTWGNWYVRTNPLRPGSDPQRSASEPDVGVVRALHLDVDEATPEQLIVRLDRMGWPEPHIVVRSGGVTREGRGTQVWYLLEQPIPAQDPEAKQYVKRLIAAMLRASGGDVGTQNLSRLMRPPGFWNVKEPEQYEPRLVELVICDVERPRVRIEDFAKLVDVSKEVKTPVSGERAPSSTSAPLPVLKKIVTGCAWLRHCRDDVKTLSEPEWYRMLSVVARCADGRAWCHEWSKGYAGYQYEETEQKIEHALAGSAPFSCDEIAAISHQICEACEHHDKIKSPIALGYERRDLPPEAPSLSTGKQAVIALVEKATEDATAAIEGVLSDPAVIERFATVMRLEPGIFASASIKLEEAGARVKHIGKLDDVVKAAARRQIAAENVRAAARHREGLRVGQVLANAPSPDLCVPPAWRLDEKGVAAEKRNREGYQYYEVKCGTPLLITGRMQDIETGQISLALAWFYGGRWRRTLLARENVTQASEIIRELSSLGADVHSQNKIAVIEWCSAFERWNSDVLPLIESISHMGWISRSRFVLGRQVIDEKGVHPLAGVDPEHWGPGSVGFRKLGEGDEEILDGYAVQGTLEAWLAAIEPIRNYPRVQVAIYAALAAPLLRILRQPPFIVEWCDQSSSGKTSALIVGASTCGNCNERAPATLIRPWSGTDVWIDRALGIACNAPLFLDDTRKARDPRQIPQIVYTITGGMGKGRGAPRGVQTTGNWNTIVLSTGEAKIVDYGGEEQGGTYGRVLCLWGRPWIQKDIETAEVINQVKAGIEQNYGHAMPALLLYVLRNQQRWPEWRKWWRESQAGYLASYYEATQERAVEFAHRITGYAAVLDLAATLAHEALRLPWDKPDLWEVLRPAILEGVEGADRPMFALRLAVEDAMTRTRQYYAREDRGYAVSEKEEPPMGWRGRWDRQRPYWEWIGFTSRALAELFKPHEMRFRTVARWWKDRGWLELDPKDDSYQVVTAVGESGKARMYRVKRSAIELIVPGIGRETSPQNLLGENPDSPLDT